VRVKSDAGRRPPRPPVRKSQSAFRGGGNPHCARSANGFRHVVPESYLDRGIILSGHCGGYRVISAILDRGGRSAHVKEVWLFDALYAESDRFLMW